MEGLKQLNVYSSYVEDNSYVDNESQALEALKYKIGDAIVKRHGYYVLDGVGVDSVRVMTVGLLVKDVRTSGVHKTVDEHK